jgi:hypothetical protein
MSKLHIEVKFRNLTKQDRCDRCGDQATTIVRLQPILELLFCDKHYAEHKDVIAECGFVTSTTIKESE